MKKLVVITGASSGIGQAIAKKFSKEGHPLLLLARRVELMEQMNLPNTLCKKLDVLDLESFKKTIKEAEDVYGKVDCLINNAGMLLLGDPSVQDPKEWDQMFDVNVKGLLNGIQTVLPSMKERQTGTIINMSSLASRKAYPKHAVYCGTKFAVNGISENIRWEVANDNVRVIVIAPGAVETELITHGSDKAAINNYKNWKENVCAAISTSEIADVTFYSYNLPQSVCIREVYIAPTKQMN